MKKVLKSGIVTAIVSAVVALCITLSGCFSVKPKYYSKEGMNITLNSLFTELIVEEFTATYVSVNSLVMALKEDFSDTTVLTKDTTLQEYTSLVIDNAPVAVSEVNAREGKEYLWFTYENVSEGKTFFYLATTHKASDAFWLIQFACEVSKGSSMQNTFLGYADTVTFTEQSAQSNG
ncbi:MAG: hypothetical protein ACI4MS_05310 [Candidatus Coproplasma sp.]